MTRGRPGPAKPAIGPRERFISTADKAANVVLAAGGVVCAVAFAYFLYHYGWVRDREFAGWLGVLQYYVAPAVAGLAFLIALRLKADHKINLALACLALIASVYAAEVVLWLTRDPFTARDGSVMTLVHREAAKDRKKLAAELTRRYGGEVDSRDTLEVITDLRRAGVDAVPFVIPRLQVQHQNPADPSRLIALGGISNKLTVLCNESGQFITYESDEHGFRNPRGLWRSGRADIAAVGDSFTQGYCVPAEKSFVGLIGQQYPRTFNLGMAGEGPLSMLATIQEYLSRLKPRVVLWFYFEGNDLLDLADERRSAVFMRYLQDDFSQRLFERQAEIDQALERFVENETVLERKKREARERNAPGIAGHLSGMLKLGTLRRGLGLVQGVNTEEVQSVSDLDTTRMDLFRTILSLAQSHVDSWGGQLYFIYLPNWPRDEGRYSPGLVALKKQRTRVLATARNLGVPIIDVLPAFQADPDPMGLLPFRKSGHYNEKGHSLVAEVVLKAIAKHAQGPESR
jgi:lysophospholipase L1-like esterase